MQDKVETMLNFAIRARKIVMGTDNIENSRKKCLIVICHTLSERSKAKIIKDNPTIPVLISKRELAEVIHKSGKAIAVTDRNMVKEILKNYKDNYELISEGE